MITSLILVRHGQTEHNVAGLTAGWTDSPLSEFGRIQTQVVATHIATTYKLDALYASPLQRAYETACAIGAIVGLEPVTDLDLREQNFGDVEGLTIEEANAKFPDLSRAAKAVEDLMFTWPNGEMRSDFYERVVRVHARILDDHRGGTVCVVSHGGVIGAYVAGIEEGKAYLWRKYLVDNCSVTVVTDEDGKLAVSLYNDVSFLPERPRDRLTSSLREAGLPGER